MTEFSSPELLKQRLGGRNLYLVGMMGSGKSSTGPYLADELSYGFVDGIFGSTKYNTIEQIKNIIT